MNGTATIIELAGQRAEQLVAEANAELQRQATDIERLRSALSAAEAELAAATADEEPGAPAE